MPITITGSKILDDDDETVDGGDISPSPDTGDSALAMSRMDSMEVEAELDFLGVCGSGLES